MKTLTRCLFLLILAGCTSDKDYHKGEYETVNLHNAPADLWVPQLLWNKIEELSKKPKGAEGHGKGSALPDSSNSYAPVHVFLMEETPGALRGRNLELVFGKGGGNLDLAEYVDAGAKSDFVFGVDVPGIDKATQVKVFFLNNAKPRKIAGNLYGTSCNEVLDITKFFQTRINRIGLRVTAQQNLYLNLLVGSYIIAFKTETAWAMTQLTITDSRFSDLLCRAEITAAGG